ncbi:hypothetical protein BD779DRAFT_1666474 [Infundibulicybe gibba]|nr:hypothetical protein BD779DRAFT_1666474 [Infundibulicybe gibba]
MSLHYSHFPEGSYSLVDGASSSYSASPEFASASQPTVQLTSQSPPNYLLPPSRRQGSELTTAPKFITHPYARLNAKRDEVKRRRIWNHTLEKFIFSPYELSTVGASKRRPTYIASLEAHVDRLHDQMFAVVNYPPELESLRGTHTKTVKSMISGLQHDASVARLKLLELERANEGLRLAIQRYETQSQWTN